MMTLKQYYGKGKHQKLNAGKVKDIRLKHADGFSYRDLSTEYGITTAAISWIINERTWDNESLKELESTLPADAIIQPTYTPGQRGLELKQELDSTMQTEPTEQYIDNSDDDLDLIALDDLIEPYDDLLEETDDDYEEATDDNVNRVIAYLQSDRDYNR